MKEVVLTRGLVALIDDEDFDDIGCLKRCASDSGYAVRGLTLPSGKYTKQQMHRRIMGLAYGDERQIDHVNGNRADSRRENLRICTPGENNRNFRLRSNNRSGYKGVHWNKALKSWDALIQINRKPILASRFETADEAAHAYNKVAILHFGEFAVLNPVGKR